MRRTYDIVSTENDVPFVTAYDAEGVLELLDRSGADDAGYLAFCRLKPGEAAIAGNLKIWRYSEKMAP